MRRLLVLAPLACVAVPVDMVQTDGALGRQVERMLQRHDSYVLDDVSLAPEAADEALEQAGAVKALMALPEVRRAALRGAVLPVADRHDAYVRADVALDQLEVETYLGSTDSLRRFLAVE